MTSSLTTDQFVHAFQLQDNTRAPIRNDSGSMVAIFARSALVRWYLASRVGGVNTFQKFEQNHAEFLVMMLAFYLLKTLSRA